MTEEISKNCKHFVQHAWKQNLCANCFESREYHRRKLKQLNTSVPDFAASVKSILRGHENNQRQQKNVKFRLSLTEIIGYGGDDLYDFSEYNSDNFSENDSKDSNNAAVADDNDADDDNDDDDEDDDDEEDDIDKQTELTEEMTILKEIISSSDEEDRELSIITRSNTNFNRITTNFNKLPGVSTLLNDAEKITPKYFDNLMLGHIQKDPEGKRKPLLVSVTPFGSSNHSCVISAGGSDKVPSDDEKKRIISQKINKISNIESRYASTFVPNNQLLKLDETSNKKCFKENESIILNTTESNHDELINEEINVHYLKNNNLMENVLLTDCSINPLVSVKQTVIKSDVEDKKELSSIEENKSLSFESRKNDEINDMKVNETIIYEETSSDSSSIDCSTMNLLPGILNISSKPRNSFLHGGKSVNDIENPSVKSEEVNIEVNSLSYIENEEKITPKLPEKLSEDLSSSIFTRKPASILKSDCPVVREKEKRERATSCSPKFRKMDENLLNRNYNNNEIPETTSKLVGTRSLTRHSSSPYSQVLSQTNGVDDEIKKKNKTRFSLKRLLRIGSSKKDLNITTDSFVEGVNNIPSVSQFKNRPEIIHPLELDGAAVEILHHDKLINITDEITGTKSQNIKVTMREPPPPPPTNECSSTKPNCHQLSMNKSARLALNNEHENIKLSTHDVDREHPSCHSISPTTTSSVHSITADSIHTGIHNFGKFRPIQCN